MAESKDDLILRQSCTDYLEKSGVTKQIKEATIKLIENRPNEPMLFLSEFFDNFCSTEQNDKINSATQVLKLSHFSQPTFQTNLMIAYDLLSAPKNPNSKKVAYTRRGLLGMVFNDAIKEIIKHLHEKIQEAIVEKINARPNEMITFDVFKYGMNVCYIIQDFVATSQKLYALLQGNKSHGAEKCLCDLVSTAFEKSIKTSAKSLDPSDILNANKLFRPDALALQMLEIQSKIDEELIEEEDFVFSLASTYLDNLEAL